MRKHFLLVFLITLIFSSCATRDEIVYFQNLEKLDDMEAIEQFEPRIEVNDVLRIDVSSLNPEVVQPFRMDNTGSQSGGGGGGGNNAVLNGYLVDAEGNIRFPVLGEISVINRTRSEVEELLIDQLRDYVKDVVVRVRIVNFKITVLGETGSSVIQVPDERISVPEAIAMAGDITYNGKRENILILRMENGKVMRGRIDLTDAGVFNSPYFYLKQNDILYVEPTYRQVKSAGFVTSWQGIVSIVTTAFSLYFLFTQ